MGWCLNKIIPPGKLIDHACQIEYIPPPPRNPSDPVHCCLVPVVTGGSVVTGAVVTGAVVTGRIAAKFNNQLFKTNFRDNHKPHSQLDHTH